MSSQFDRPEGGEGFLFPLDDRDGPAAPLSDIRAKQMANAVLARAWATPPRAKRRRRVALVLLAAAIALVTMSALAGMWLRRRQAPSTTPAETTSAVPAVSGTPASNTAEAPSAVPVEEPAPVESAPSASETPIARPSTSISAQPSPAPAGPQRPADLLRQANQLRAQKRWADAERMYRRVATEYPGTQEAYAGTVAAASIRLEHLGDPNGARALYGEAQQSRPNGGLSEEAEFGVAESYRAAGNERAETAALRSFLAHHPDSPLRAKAQARLAELETRRSSGPPQ